MEINTWVEGDYLYSRQGNGMIFSHPLSEIHPQPVINITTAQPTQPVINITIDPPETPTKN